MITLTVDGAGARLSGVPESGTAYVDADWVRPGVPGPLPALLVDGTAVAWSDGPAPGVPGAGDADSVAAAVWGDWADRAGAPLVGAERVEVTGHGLLAARVRAHHPPAAPRRGARPDAVVETTGDPEVVVLAMGRLATAGVLVLAGEPLGRRLDVNLYKDVHVRGLRVIGVDRPRAGDARPADGVAPRPVAVAPDAPLAPGAWYRLER